MGETRTPSFVEKMWGVLNAENWIEKTLRTNHKKDLRGKKTRE